MIINNEILSFKYSIIFCYYPLSIYLSKKLARYFDLYDTKLNKDENFAILMSMNHKITNLCNFVFLFHFLEISNKSAANVPAPTRALFLFKILL